MSLSKITSYTSLGFLGGLGVYKLVKDKRFDSSNLRAIRNLELLILAIASGQYVISFNMPFPRLQRWRYLDWIITTPLLLRTFHLLAVEKGFKGSFAPALVANLIMIGQGYAAEFPNGNPRYRKPGQLEPRDLAGTRRPFDKERAYAISFGAMLVIFYFVNKWDTFLRSKGVDTGRLPHFFYFGWTIYAVNFLNPNEEARQSVFNIMDFINKGLYNLELDRVIRENFE